MDNTRQTSIRGNSLPAGGAVSTTESSQAQPLIPDTITLQRISENLMNASEYNTIQLNQVSLLSGGVANFTINNVGLGESLDLVVSGSISIVNAGGSSKTLTLSPEFPFSLIQNMLVQFNGATVIANLSGYECLGVMAKRNKGLVIGYAASGGASFAQNLGRVDKVYAEVTAGANMTVNAGNGITGSTSIQVTLSSTGILNVKFFLQLPFVLRKDLLLGLLPLQNNSVYCNVSLSTPTILGTTAASPIYDPSLTNISLGTVAMTVTPHYNFWSIPMPKDHWAAKLAA